MGYVDRVSKATAENPTSNTRFYKELGILSSPQAGLVDDNIGFDEFCEGENAGIGNVSVDFDRDPAEFPRELQSLFMTSRNFDFDE